MSPSIRAASVCGKACAYCVGCTLCGVMKTHGFTGIISAF